MSAKVELKARIASVDALLPRAAALADDPPQRIHQDDTFFDVTYGRLKLRVFADGSGELIHYLRPDDPGSGRDGCVSAPVIDPDALRATLARACGEIGRVRKQRTLVLVGRSRIHLDRVEGLGDFVEIEVVLGAGQSEAEGRASALALLGEMGVGADALVGRAYLDLLAELE